MNGQGRFLFYLLIVLLVACRIVCIQRIESLMILVRILKLHCASIQLHSNNKHYNTFHCYMLLYAFKVLAFFHLIYHFFHLSHL